MNNLILTTELDGVLTITLNRLSKKNALNNAMYQQLTSLFEYSNKTDSIKVVCIQGSESCFCAGNDLHDFTQPQQELAAIKFIQVLSTFTKPLVAAVAGPCIGIGTTLLLHCDIIIASQSCYFKLPFTQLGLCPEAGSSYLLSQRLGYNKAFELLVLGESFDVNTAFNYGLINQISTDKQLLNQAQVSAKKIAALPANAVQASKHLIKQSHTVAINQAIELEVSAFTRLLSSKSCQDILKQFLT